jgi:hypothetical protein
MENQKNKFNCKSHRKCNNNNINKDRKNINLQSTESSRPSLQKPTSPSARISHFFKSTSSIFYSNNSNNNNDSSFYRTKSFFSSTTKSKLFGNGKLYSENKGNENDAPVATTTTTTTTTTFTSSTTKTTATATATAAAAGNDTDSWFPFSSPCPSSLPRQNQDPFLLSRVPSICPYDNFCKKGDFFDKKLAFDVCFGDFFEKVGSSHSNSDKINSMSDNNISRNCKCKFNEIDKKKCNCKYFRGKEDEDKDNFFDNFGNDFVDINTIHVSTKSCRNRKRCRSEHINDKGSNYQHQRQEKRKSLGGKKNLNDNIFDKYCTHDDDDDDDMFANDIDNINVNTNKKHNCYNDSSDEEYDNDDDCYIEEEEIKIMCENDITCGLYPLTFTESSDGKCYFIRVNDALKGGKNQVKILNKENVLMVSSEKKFTDADCGDIRRTKSCRRQDTKAGLYNDDGVCCAPGYVNKETSRSVERSLHLPQDTECDSITAKLFLGLTKEDDDIIEVIVMKKPVISENENSEEISATIGSIAKDINLMTTTRVSTCKKVSKTNECEENIKEYNSIMRLVNISI